MTIEELFTAIKFFDCEPSVYNTSVYAASHQSGYTCNVTFRSYAPAPIQDIQTHGDSPQEVLQKALTFLEEHFGKCPHCGNQRHSA
jgi:hypothetical protein